MSPGQMLNYNIFFCSVGKFKDIQKMDIPRISPCYGNDITRDTMDDI